MAMDMAMTGCDMAMAADLCYYLFHSLHTHHQHFFPLRQPLLHEVSCTIYSQHIFPFWQKPALKKWGEPRQIFSLCLLSPFSRSSTISPETQNLYSPLHSFFPFTPALQQTYNIPLNPKTGECWT